MLSYVVKSLWRNPLRVLAAVAGVGLAVALFADTALFVDGSGRRMTSRAIAHVSVDMQARVNEPLASSLSLAASLSPRPPLAAGQAVTVTLVATNNGPLPARAVVVEAPVPAQLGYQPGSTQRDGAALPDLLPSEEEQPSPLAPLEPGLVLGDLAPGASVTVTYTGSTRVPVASAADLLSSSVRSAEEPSAAPANGPRAVDLAALTEDVRAVPDVRAAQPLGLVDLPAGAVEVGGQILDAPVKLLALDPSYARDIPIIAFTGGRFEPGSAFLSPALAQRLGATERLPVTLRVPGLPAGMPLILPIGAVANLTRADQLFASRDEESEGEFVAAPYVVGVDMATFQRQVLPALRVDAAADTPTLAPPILEVDAQIDRAVLASDPASALRATSGVRRSVEQAAPGEVTVLDNLSASLTRARTDSTLAKILFIALGLPGAVLAGYLAFYGGGLLAEAEQRERALLRARGFTPSTLARGLVYQGLAIAVLGSAVGVALAIGVANLMFPTEFSPRGAGFSVSIVLAVAVSLITTMLAVHLPARRALLSDVTEGRRSVAPTASPGWMRGRLDLVLLLVAVLVSAVFVITGGLRPNPSAHEESIARSFYILLAPWCLWLGAALLAARVFLALSRRVGARAECPDFRRRLVSRTLVRSVARRPRAVSAGIVTLSLAVAFGMSLAIFVATFRDQQDADARFTVGSDVRVTPGLGEALPADVGDRLRVPGVDAVSAVAQVSDVVLGTEKLVFAAIDPGTFEEVAPLSTGFFTGTSRDEAMEGLAADPQAVLVDKETADDFNIEEGDTIKLQVPSRALGTSTTLTLRVVGTVIQFPGFPTGLDFVGNLGAYQQATGVTTPSWFLLRTDGTRNTNTEVARSLPDALGPAVPVRVDTTARFGNADQSSVAGLSLTGLGRVEGLYMVLIASLGIIVFVTALLIQRGTERAVMRALGLPRRRLRAVILGEAAIVSTAGIVVGAVIGLPMAYMFVQILRRIFVVPPAGVSVPPSAFALLLGVLAVTLALAAALVSVAIRRLRLLELLRTE